MRATLNIVLGLLLFVMQAAALVAPHSLEKPQTCKCCSCGSNGCTTPTRTPAPSASPLSVQTAEARDEARKPGFRPAPQPAFFVAPLPVVNQTARTVTLSPSAFPQPLYERFCLLLI